MIRRKKVLIGKYWFVVVIVIFLDMLGLLIYILGSLSSDLLLKYDF